MPHGTRILLKKKIRMLLDSSILFPFIRAEEGCLILLCAFIPKGAFPDQIKLMVSFTSISKQVASTLRLAASDRKRQEQPREAQAAQGCAQGASENLVAVMAAGSRVSHRWARTHPSDMRKPA